MEPVMISAFPAVNRRWRGWRGFSLTIFPDWVSNTHLKIPEYLDTTLHNEFV
jgi:hypothetical protein